MSFITISKTDVTVPVSKILCLGSNYPDHIREMCQRPNPITITEPVVFLKPPSAIIHNGGTVVIPSVSREMHHEVELILAIGKTGKNIPKDSAGEYILGYGVGLDMTLRDIQVAAKNSGKPWTIAKGFDTSAVISEIIPAEALPDPHQQELKLWVNGELRQSGKTAEMLWRVGDIIAYLSRYFTLKRGDLIFTGTPAGVGPVKDGDTIKACLGSALEISVKVKNE